LFDCVPEFPVRRRAGPASQQAPILGRAHDPLGTRDWGVLIIVGKPLVNIPFAVGDVDKQGTGQQSLHDATVLITVQPMAAFLFIDTFVASVLAWTRFAARPVVGLEHAQTHALRREGHGRVQASGVLFRLLERSQAFAAKTTSDSGLSSYKFLRNIISNNQLRSVTDLNGVTAEKTQNIRAQVVIVADFKP